MTSPNALPAEEVTQFATTALRRVWVPGSVGWVVIVGYEAAIGDSLHLHRNVEDLRSNGDGDPVFTRTVGRCVGGTLTSCWDTMTVTRRALA